jgi:hypothetical protein
MNVISSIQNTSKYSGVTVVAPPTPVVYYTCINADIDTVNKKIKNYANNNYDVTYNNTLFIDIDSHFANGTGKGSFYSNNSVFATGTSQYAFTSSSRAVSLCYWFKLHTINPRGFYAFDIGRGNYGTNAILPEMNYNTSTGLMTSYYIYCGNASFNTNSYVTLPSNINLQNWTHFAVIVENGKTPRMFINGTKLTPNNSSTVTLNTFTTQNGFALAGLPNGQTQRPLCKVNELRVYNSALTDAQISTIYNWNGTSALNL